MKTSHLLGLLTLMIFSDACKKADDPCVEKAWYQDADSDGLGNKAVSKMACDQPLGYVSNSDDTDDDPNKKQVAIIPTKGYSTPITYPTLKPVWSDEFSGTALDDKIWNYEIGNNNGWGNNELEYYRKENTSVRDGYLIIEAKNESFVGKNYTSSRITTEGKLNVKYGRIDIRAALPKGQGIWPALWMLGKNIKTVNWPKCGEIDIMEMVGGAGKDNTTYGTGHWDNNGHVYVGGSTKLNSGIFNDEFHVFSIIWDDKKIVWYLDDVKFYELATTPATMSEFQEDYFFIINLAVGGDWPGKPDGTTVFSQFLIVDYIRVFQ